MMKIFSTRFMRFVLALIYMCVPTLLWAQDLAVPTIIGDKMVLQRNATAHLWGTAVPNAEVVVKTSWNKASICVTADAFGRWLADVPTGEAAENQKITIQSEGERLSFSDIMLGEVWVCSGQSNMRFTVEATIDVVQALKKPNPKVRLYNTGRRSSRVPLENIYEVSWTTSAASNLRDFSAVGYAFGDKLQQELGVPIGLIGAAYGGTSIESWMPEEEILNNQCFLVGLNETLQRNAAKWKGKERYFAAAQYNANIHPLINSTIAGVIWYQGCHNVNNAGEHYDELLERFIGSWRERFHNPEMPVYVVQIAPHTYAGNAGALLREKQAKVAAKMEHVELVVTVDQNERTGDIHPRNKQVVAERLAAAALGEHYGLPVDFRSPTYQSHRSEGNKLRVTFHDAEKGLTCPDAQIVGFQVSDAMGRFHLAQAAIEGSELLVWSDEVAEPVNIRYCFDECEGNLFCSNGLPVTPFRTDFDALRLGARSFYGTLTPMTVTVKYKGCRKIPFSGKQIRLWQNKNWIVQQPMKELLGWEVLAPNMLEVGELTPRVQLTAHADGYVYILARQITLIYDKEGWEVIPCTNMPLVDLDKKNRPRGYVFLCRHAVKKGETVTLPPMETMGGVHPIAQEIIYEQ